MRLIDADKIYVIPAEDDNITGMGMTREEQDAYNDGVDAVMAKIKSAKTVDAVSIDRVLEIIDKEAEKLQLGGYGKVVGTFYYEEIKRAVLALKGGEQYA